MAREVQLGEADRDRVTQAVAAAEAGTDGEIVTIVAERSDRYRDVALHYAVAAMLLIVALAALEPGWVEAKIALLDRGWAGEPDLHRSYFALMIFEAIAFLIVRYAVAWPPLRHVLTPHATRARRVRRRAIDLFKVGAESRTAARVGILLYLSLDERIAEIVADESIHGAVPPERWGDAMGALIHAVREGRAADGMAAAVGQIGAILSEHFPKTEGDVNELPDRLIEL